MRPFVVGFLKWVGCPGLPIQPTSTRHYGLTRGTYLLGGISPGQIGHVLAQGTNEEGDTL